MCSLMNRILILCARHFPAPTTVFTAYVFILHMTFGDGRIVVYASAFMRLVRVRINNTLIAADFLKRNM